MAYRPPNESGIRPNKSFFMVRPTQTTNTPAFLSRQDLLYASASFTLQAVCCVPPLILKDSVSHMPYIVDKCGSVTWSPAASAVKRHAVFYLTEELRKRAGQTRLL